MSRTTRRTGLGGVVAVLVLLGLAVPAWAYFSVTSSAATGAGRAASLGTPSVTTSGVSSSSVTFTVTAPASGPAPTGYRVARTAPTASSSVCTISGANGSCTGTPVAGQTNTFAVYAVLAGTTWESPTPATTSVAVPSADTSAPVTTASQAPSANGAGWNTGDVVVTLSATDASGVAGTWYTTDGTTPTTSSTAYSGPFTVTASSTVKFFSADTIGNTEAVKSLTVQIDRAAPAAAVTSPTANSVNGGAVTVSGTASDVGSGLASLSVQYQRNGTTTWTTLATPSVSAETWSASWSTASLADDGYSLRVVATDLAGNTTTSATLAITLKNTFTVTAPATATAGTLITVSLSTYPGYTGSHTITVTGLQASPSGATPTLPTSATFTNGAATISVIPVRSGSQSITVTDSTLASLTGTSGSITVNAGTASNLAWTNWTGVTPPSSCYFTCSMQIGNNNVVTATISVTDARGNIVSNLGTARTVTVSAPNPSGGTPNGAQTLTIPATGPATSSTAAPNKPWSYSDQGSWTSHSFTATSSGFTQATLTVTK